jgi:hypothetical protein
VKTENSLALRVQVHVQKFWMSLSPLARKRIPVVACFFLGGLIAFAACGGCGRRNGGEDTTAASASASAASASASSAASLALIVDASKLRDPLLWKHAMNGDVEDLTALATHEGAAGLVEAASSDKELRPTAIRAMGYARGWAQLPFLAKTANGKDDEEAKLALDGAIELSSRPRRLSEDNEDAEELKEGCESLGALAKDSVRPRGRRIAAIRALRMMPCNLKDIPTDLDAK